MRTKTIWYIQPLTESANGALSNYYEDTEIQIGLPTETGPQNLWHAKGGYSDVVKFAQSTYSYAFYKQDGESELPKLWEIPDHLKKKKREKKVT